MRRIVVVGTTGSGKSTLAEKIGARLGMDWVDLDALNWEPNWEMAPQEVFEQRVNAVTSQERWVIAGNYSRVRALIWSRADTLVWLDYPFWLVFWRLTKRTFTRIITREELWGTGNRETWGKAFGRDSLFLWFFKTYGRRKREYPQLLDLPENAHLTVIRQKHPRQAETWLNTIAPSDG
jgi:adenylate kinase family enzyme